MNPLRTWVRRLALKTSLTLTSVVAVTAAGATVASAGVLVLPDFDDDVIGIDDYGIDYGDYEMDLRSVRIDHQSTNLVVTHTFDVLNSSSFDALFMRIDTNGDSSSDYLALYSPIDGSSHVTRGDLGNSGAVTCTPIGVSSSFGTPGTVTVTIPRRCIGNPSQVAINTNVFWAGYNSDGGDLYFADTVPGEFDLVEYSAMVRYAAPPVVVAPVRSSKIVVSSRKAGRSPVKVKVTSLAKPQGKLTLKIAGKKTSAAVNGTKAVKLKLPRGLKRGTYRATVTFTPSNPKVIKASSTKVTVKVR